jgi:fructokinase
MHQYESTPVVLSGFIALDVVYAPDRPPLLAAGGSCGNVSANLAALGFRALPVVVLGDDEEGRIISRDLLHEGVELTFVEMRQGVRTPIVIHEVLTSPTVEGRDHRFRVNSPQSGVRFPRYKSIDDSQFEHFLRAKIEPRAVYFDRLSPAILRMAKWARRAGAITFFEPSAVEDVSLFKAVMQHVDILKFSTDRLSPKSGLFEGGEPSILIATTGASGLNLRYARTQSAEVEWMSFAAEPSPKVVDSAGAGDAVSAALIATTCTEANGAPPTRELVIEGLRRGQRLAALNCSFIGARGAFRDLPKWQILSLIGDDHTSAAPLPEKPTRCRV